MAYPLDNPFRRPYEFAPAIVFTAGAALVLGWPHWFLLPPTLGAISAIVLVALAALRLTQAMTVRHARRNLTRLELYALTQSQVPQSRSSVFLGLGFEWDERHTQRMHLVRLPEFRHLLEPSRAYRWARAVERRATNDTWLTRLTQSPAWWNPVSPLPPLGGNPALHGIEPIEQEIWTPLAEMANHTMVYGTTGVGKTRLAQVIIGQDIRRGDVVVVFDPKGDVDLLLGMYADAVRAGREKEFQVFHLGFPDISARYNPIGNFEQITEVATRATGSLPDEGQSAAFKAFAWRYVNVIARAMAATGEKPDFRKIYRYGVNIDQLVKAYLEQLLSQVAPGWEDEFDPTPTRDMKDVLAKAAKNGRDEGVIMLTQFFRSRGHLDQIADALISILSNDRTYFEKLVNSLYPLLEKLTTGKLADLISPDYMDATDPRPILDWMSVINRRGIVYVGLDSLTIRDVAETVGASMFADLTSVAGSIYKHTASYGMSTAEGQRRVRLHADELNELIGPEFVQMANKGRGAGVNITGYSQTRQDIEAKVGSAAKAEQIGGNLNTLIMLRVKNKETAELLCDQLAEVRITTRTVASAVTDANDPTEFADFASRNEDRISLEKVPMIEPAWLTRLPKGQAFALLEGGRLVKFRIPLATSEPADNAPSSWTDMLAHMRARYGEYLQRAPDDTLTVEGLGRGF